jgi:CIC family chloride channel protein
MSVHELADELEKTGHHGFPVVDEEGYFSGVVTMEDLEASVVRSDPNLTVGDIAMKNPLTVYPDQSIHDALAQLGGRDVGRIPVVDRSDPRRLVGVLRRHDIIRAYTSVSRERWEK